MDYKKAGVDIEAGYKSVELMKEHVKKTMREEVLGGLGGFSGAFSLAKIKNMEEPVLLSGTDGCGTKVKLAIIMDKHDTIGIDAVAMCVNDIACAGGEPLFFLDYIACGKNYPEKIADIVKGVAEGCLQSEAALIGGETAEHPGLMPEEDYDLAGGGFYENVPRMLKEGTRAVIKKDSYEVPAIFKMLAEKGDIAEEMMYNTFNMGLGMIVAVDPADVEKTMEAIKATGDVPYVIGSIEAGEKGVTLC